MSERFFGLLFCSFTKGYEKEAVKVRRPLYVSLHCVDAMLQQCLSFYYLSYRKGVMD